MQRLDLHTITQTEVIKQAVAVLAAGGLVIFPTETTYGAGVDALNPDAVQKLLQYKSRREGKPLSIAVDSLAMAEQFIVVNESAERVYERFLPGPVTVISEGKHVVAAGVESEFGTLGVRIPDYQLILDLIAFYGHPITATSANGSDAKRPYTVADILDNLSDKQKSLIDLVIDAGELPHNPPSTVIDTTLSTPVIFRQGETEVIKPTSTLELYSTSETETKAIAGRLLLEHWSDLKKKGVIIGLNGSLGVGKTIFAKGVAEFLQVKEPVTSPTYTYVSEYDFLRHGVAGQFFHYDVWRVDNIAEMERLGLRESVGANRVIVVEWAQKVAEYLQKVVEETGAKFVEVNMSEEREGRKLEIKD